jgi:hypothetical protein
VADWRCGVSKTHCLNLRPWEAAAFANPWVWYVETIAAPAAEGKE